MQLKAVEPREFLLPGRTAKTQLTATQMRAIKRSIRARKPMPISLAQTARKLHTQKAISAAVNTRSVKVSLPSGADAVEEIGKSLLGCSARLNKIS